MRIEIEDITVTVINEPRATAVTELQKSTLAAIVKIAEKRSKTTLRFIAAVMDTKRSCITTRILQLERAGWIKIDRMPL